MDNLSDSNTLETFEILNLLKDEVLVIKKSAFKLDDLMEGWIKYFNLLRDDILRSDIRGDILEKINIIADNFASFKEELVTMIDNTLKVEARGSTLSVNLSLKKLDIIDHYEVGRSGLEKQSTNIKVKKERNESISECDAHFYNEGEKEKTIVKSFSNNLQNESNSDTDIDSNLTEYASSNYETEYTNKGLKSDTVCEICRKDFINCARLKKHMLSHTGKKLWKCEVCGVSYKHKRLLNTHKLQHASEDATKLGNSRQINVKEEDSFRINEEIDSNSDTLDYIKCNEDFTDIDQVRTHKCKQVKSVEENQDAHKQDESKKYCCNICQKFYENALHLMMHMKSHSCESPYKCDICHQAYKEKRTLIKHKKVKHLGQKPEKNFKCEICNKTFESGSKLKRHMRSHTGETPYKCDVCGVSYRENRSLARHKMKHWGEEGLTTYKCDLCESVFVDANLLKKHRNTGSCEKAILEYKCENCNLMFYDSTQIVKHKQKCRFKCEKCNACFTLSSQLKIHERAHLGEKPYMCCKCQEGFGEITFLRKHQVDIHNEDTKAYSKYLLRCGECNQCFKKYAHYANHLLIHTGERPFTCEYCGKSYKERNPLNVHIRTHTGERPYKCQTCGRGFVSKTMCNEHERIHSGKKCFQCSQCGKSFAQKTTLNAHMVVHTGEKPHKCSVCSMVFSHRSSLAKHMFIHTGRKPHTCDKCGKCFARLDYLRDHQTSHTGVKAYGCQLCGKHFGTSTMLKRHIKKVCSVKAGLNNSLLCQT